MNLQDRIITGKIKKPPRVLVYGPPGVGKSTFASQCDKPLFLDIEKRTEHLDVPRIEVNSWNEFLGLLGELLSKNPNYNTVVVDTADALETLIHKHLCELDGVTNIAEYGKGWGKGVAATNAEWHRFCRAMEALRCVGYTMVVLAHSQIRMFKNPSGEDYDRYQLKLSDGGSGILRERVDLVGFATFEDYTNVDKNTSKAKAVTTGERVLKFSHHPSYESKRGVDVPDKLPLSWSKLDAALNPTTSP